ncbi:MAG: hypothetical protein JWM89_3725, partial [Acidimicrobiales bacterium]|nr:hypothetical protein [Acidimicrobiales bacterium]
MHAAVGTGDARRGFGRRGSVRAVGGARKVRATGIALAIVAATVTAVAGSAAPARAGSFGHDLGKVTFTTSGACVDGTFTVPPGITAVTVTAVGGAGNAGSANSNQLSSYAGGAAGKGSKIVTTVPVTPGMVLYANVAEPITSLPPDGSGAGGPGGIGDQDIGANVNPGGHGGSSSWVTNADPGGACAPAPASVLTVAAGGGGGGGGGTRGPGGAGGTETVNSGHGGDGDQNGQDDGAGGAGGTTSTGGGGGAGGHNSIGLSGCRTGGTGETGLALQGGRGGNAAEDPGGQSGCQGMFTMSGAGGGAGGGWYGGGGGGGADDNRGAGGAGGAGASYVVSGGSVVTAATAANEATSISIMPGDTDPLITTGSSRTVTVGIPMSLTVRATGYPLPTLGFGQVPGNVFQTDNHDGSLTISGTPSQQTGGVLSTTLTATNVDDHGVTHTASQAFTFTINQSPGFFAIDHTTFAVGTADSFDIKTQGGYPSPVLTKSGTLPAGITFVDDGDGTARLVGTAAEGSGGVYPITVTAANAATTTLGTPVTRDYTLSVTPFPTTLALSSTSNPSAPGQSIRFIATVTPVVPGVYVRFSLDGSLYAMVATEADGTATSPATSTLPAGNHTVTANFEGGNGGYGASVAPPLTQSVQVFSSAYSGTSLTATPASPPSFRLQASGGVYAGTPPAGVTLKNSISLNGHGITMDSSGNIYTYTFDPTDKVRVLKIAPDGTWTFVGPSLGNDARGIAVDQAGNVYVGDDLGGRILKVTPAGALSVVISGIQPYAAGTPLDIQGMAIDAAGDLFYSDASYGRVIQLPPPYTGTPTVLASGLGYPAAVAVDASGTVFVEDATGKRVVKISPSGTQTTVATGLHGGTALAVDGAGNLLISDGTTTNVLLLAPPYTGTPTVVTTGHSVQGLTFAPSTGVGSPTQAVTLKSTVIS